MTSTCGPTPSFRSLDEPSRAPAGQHVLGVVEFTTGCADPDTDQGHPRVAVHLADSPDDGFAETWTTQRPVRSGRSGSLRYAQDGEFLFVACRVPEQADYVDATEAAYTEALDLADSLGYRRIFRIWHYISQVNAQQPSGLEVYREFCVGRARVLERRGLTGDMPAATVIGSRSGGIVFYYLACRTGAATLVNIDNPRQVPPYHYPARYGPKSPNFARASYLAPDGGDPRLYVSGTAAILGHQTRCVGDVVGQCRLALANIAHLIGAGNLSVYDIEPGSALAELRHVKVYVRHAADIDRVREICQEALPASADIVFLRADICRSDLLVELEGIVRRPPTTTAAVPATLPGGHTTRRALATPEWESLPAAQQPDWQAHPSYKRVRDKLSAAPPLVLPSELTSLRAQLADVAAGAARVLQLGDCAESFYESSAADTARKIGVLNRLADQLGVRAGQPVVRIGRIGGQYAKPRSHPAELVDGVELPAFRGHLVNAEAPSPQARNHDPARMLWAYQFSADAQRILRARRDELSGRAARGPWSSHDALVMDYIGALVRVDEATGDRFLGSTHFPWVGERTGGLGDAQVRLLSLVSNPVAGKIGPRATTRHVLGLCAVLDPHREPGRLTLIVRMGHAAIGAALPPIVRAVRDAGHPVVWLCDPMHGNTVRLPSGIKVRYVDHLVAEVTAFRDILRAHGAHVGGLHLETAAEDVTECVGGDVAEADVPDRYTTLCDPRLNFAQAAELIDRVF